MHPICKGIIVVVYVLLGFFGNLHPVLGSDWPAWRGPNQNGSSSEVGLISNWSRDGENVIWKADFIGRSTPIVLNNRVYVIGRIGQGITEQERVACFDAETGKIIWEHRFNVFHSTIPFNRLGWTSLAADTETGNIYAHTISGILSCFDKDGEILWSRSLTEEFGRFTGYGGRVATPVVDGNLVVVSFLNTSWGTHAAMRHRYFAFDISTGEVVWTATPGGPPKNTTYSVGVVGEMNGRRLLIDANADGHVYAMDVRTGENVWGFRVSRGALNSSVVIDGTRVYAVHNQENVDSTVMGGIVCIDGTGRGDVTESHEMWRIDGIEAGYSSPALGGDGRLYVVDSSANLYCLDTELGEIQWIYSLGTVGKGSPVLADGKIYVTEVNGHFHILLPGENECTSFDAEHIEREAGRYAEIYGSPAIAYSRVYFVTDEGLYCLGDRASEFSPGSIVEFGGRTKQPSSELEVTKKPVGAVTIQIVPTEVIAKPGETIQFTARGFDDGGQPVDAQRAKWSVEGLSGEIDENGKLRLARSATGQGGTVLAEMGSLRSSGRVRVIPRLPWLEDFESIEEGDNPRHWVRATNRFLVLEMDGNKVLVKRPALRGLHRSDCYIGPPTMKDYTIQVDLMGTKPKRNLPDMGLISNRYTLEMLGNHQRLQVLSWRSDLRMAKWIHFVWEANRWYTMKMRVDLVDDRAIVRGRVWLRDESEPAEWTITVEDSLPNREGSPGIYAYSPSEVYFDNLRVW